MPSHSFTDMLTILPVQIIQQEKLSVLLGYWEFVAQHLKTI
jgi:hypothetical protein